MGRRRKPKLGLTVDKSECVIWPGAKTKDGYALVFRNGKTRPYQRLLYKKLKGPIAKGLCVCHRCDTPSCVNPNHLFLATHAENMRDKVLKGRIRVLFGEDHKSAKMTDKLVREIRVLRKMGYTYQALADKYNVVTSCIWKIANRKAWKHVK